MEQWGNDNKRDNLIRICETIFDYKEKKKDLELQLSEEQLRHDYILKRKDILVHRIFVYFLAMLPFIAYIFVVGITLFSIWAVAVIVIILALLLAGQIKVVVQLIMSSKVSFISSLAEKYNWNTFQEEERQSFVKMDLLKKRIQGYEEQIAALTEERNHIQSEEEREKEKTTFFGIETSVSGRFQLKEADVTAEDKVAIYEYLEKEEQYIRNYLTGIDGKLKRCEKEIIEINDNFDDAKKKIIISILIFIVMIIVQAVFKGALYNATAVICIIVSLFGIFYLEHVCKRPILLYLIEHDSNFTKEYAFVNNMTSIGNKRKQILEEIEECRKELEEVKSKKDAMDME